MHLGSILFFFFFFVWSVHLGLVREEMEIEKGDRNEVGVHTGMGLEWVCFMLGLFFGPVFVGFDGLSKLGMVVRKREREREKKKSSVSSISFLEMEIKRQISPECCFTFMFFIVFADW